MATIKKTTTKKTATAKATPVVSTKHTVLSGIVTKAAMQKTVIVTVTRLVKHPKYQKYQTLLKKYKVHDEAGTAKVGDKVSIIETRPISKDKHFTLITK